jgi:hypothetical protein
LKSTTCSTNRTGYAQASVFLVGNLLNPAPKRLKTIAYIYFADPKHPLRRFLKTKTGSFLAPFF